MIEVKIDTTGVKKMISNFRRIGESAQNLSNTIIQGTGTMEIKPAFIKWLTAGYDKRQRRRYMRNYKLGKKGWTPKV